MGSYRKQLRSQDCIHLVGIARRDGLSAAGVRDVVGPGNNHTLSGFGTNVAHAATARGLLYRGADDESGDAIMRRRIVEIR